MDTFNTPSFACDVSKESGVMVMRPLGPMSDVKEKTKNVSVSVVERG